MRKYSYNIIAGNVQSPKVLPANNNYSCSENKIEHCLFLHEEAKGYVTAKLWFYYRD